MSTLHPVVQYVPGGDADALSRRLGRPVIKLASNENPSGPPPGARAVIEDVTSRAHLYPEPNSESLTAALAQRLGTGTDEILVCAGGTEAIQLAAMVTAIGRPGSAVVAPYRSFLAYRVAASQVGLRALDVPLVDERLDLHAMLAAARDPEVSLVYLANPNNPTGTSVAPQQLMTFLEQVPEHVLVVLDEAYIEYLAPERRVDAVALCRRRTNMVVIRTFSKVYGLAALRVGYMIGAAPTIARIARLTMPFRVSAIAQRAALAALGDESFVASSVAHNSEQRRFLTRELVAMGLSPTRSDGNFVVVDLGRPAAPIAEALCERGVMVRTLEPYGMDNALRISVGLAEHNRVLLHALEAILRDEADGYVDPTRVPTDQRMCKGLLGQPTGGERDVESVVEEVGDSLFAPQGAQLWMELPMARAQPCERRDQHQSGDSRRRGDAHLTLKHAAFDLAYRVVDGIHAPSQRGEHDFPILGECELATCAMKQRYPNFIFEEGDGPRQSRCRDVREFGRTAQMLRLTDHAKGREPRPELANPF